MRLRTRLAFAFVTVAVVPLVLVVPLAATNLRKTLSQGFESRIQGATAATQTVIQRSEESAVRALDELAESMALEDFARDLQSGSAKAEKAMLGERLMNSRGLTVLSLFDARGVTLSSGHLRARLGDPDPSLFAATQLPGGQATPVLVETRDENGVHQVPALVAARSVEYGELKLWAVGGYLLDQDFVGHLSQLTGARVEIAAPEGLLATAGTAEEPSARTAIDLPAVARITLAFSRAPQVNAERGLARAFALLTAFGLTLAFALGLLMARHITRPVEALTAATRDVASGALDIQVAQTATGEVGELVHAFNQMTTQLQQVTEQLVTSERVAAWQEVARRLAHEIKNPLTPIQMSLETLVAASQAGSPNLGRLFEESVGAMLEEVERLRRIVDEFSRFARLPKPQMAPLDLCELLHQALALHLGQGGGIHWNADLPASVVISGDRDQLTQVLTNLIKNAEEATGSRGEIAVRLKEHGREVALEIEDSGPGIALENRLRIFEPYFTTKAGGTGLGLAIASRICQEHGGRLEVDTGSLGGALFRVILPVVPWPAAKPTSAPHRGGL